MNTPPKPHSKQEERDHLRRITELQSRYMHEKFNDWMRTGARLVPQLQGKERAR